MYVGKLSRIKRGEYEVVYIFYEMFSMRFKEFISEFKW